MMSRGFATHQQPSTFSYSTPHWYHMRHVHTQIQVTGQVQVHTRVLMHVTECVGRGPPAVLKEQASDDESALGERCGAALHASRLNLLGFGFHSAYQLERLVSARLLHELQARDCDGIATRLSRNCGAVETRFDEIATRF